jgi:hypothetical protein
MVCRSRKLESRRIQQSSGGRQPLGGIHEHTVSQGFKEEEEAAKVKVFR